MSLQITGLLTQVRETEQSKQELYVRSLWSQINPHMIYNTLNTITYLAEVQNIGNIREVSSSFAKLLHTIYNSADEFITVAEEVDFLRAYIAIKKYNTLSDIDVVFDIHEDTMDCLILKLLLQPIVENSIVHGFKDSLGENRIFVGVALSGDKLHIEISDNGSGCDERTIARLLSGEQLHTGNFLRVGLNNVIERLKLHYGNEAIFKISGVPDRGLSVYIEFPVKIPVVKNVWGGVLLC